jgi:hypothetical protein
MASGLPVGARQLTELPVLVRVPSDTLQLYYQLWLVRDGLLGPTPLFTDPYQFRVNGPRWNLPQAFLPLALPFSALSLFGLHAAYNLLVLASFPAAGRAAYGLARQLTGDATAAAVVGVGFALLPARLEPLFGGHPAGFAMALVPAVLWGLDVALTRGRLAGGVGGGAALLALAMLEPQYTYLTLGLVLVHTAVRGTLGRDRVRVAPLVLFGLLTIGAAGWVFMLRQAFVEGSIAEAGRRLDEVRLFSPGLRGLAEPARYGGLALAALALVGLALGGRRGDGGLRLLYGAIMALGILLSLGPTIPRVPLYEAFHRWLPFFAMIRNPDKLELLTSLALIIVGALGVRALLERAARMSGRRRVVVAVGLLVLVLVATPPWHGIAFARYGDHPVYEAMRHEASRVLYVPVWPGDSAHSGLYLYAITWTRVPMLNGYSPLVPRRYVSDVFQPLEALNVGDLGGGEAQALRQLRVTHVVVDRGGFPPQVSPYPSAFTVERLRVSGTLALQRAADPLWLFRVTDAPPTSNRHTSPIGVFYEAERQNHQTGAVVDAAEASGGRVVVGRPGTTLPGFLTFGPYRPLPAGAYVAQFRVRGGGLRLDVATHRGQRILAQRTVDPGSDWVDATLPFVVEHARPLEFRVFWDGQSDAAVDWVLVVAADRPEREWTYEVEKLPHRLGERRDPAASGGEAGFADPVESLRGDLVAGPARLFPAGRYQLTVRLRAEDTGRGPLARLSVTEPAGRTLAARVVDARELPPGVYHDVALDFALSRPAVLEFPVAYLGDVGLFIDRITVAPR